MVVVNAPRATWSLIRVPFGSRAAVRTISGSSPSAQCADFGSPDESKSTVLGLAPIPLTYGDRRPKPACGPLKSGSPAAHFGPKSTVLGLARLIHDATNI